MSQKPKPTTDADRAKANALIDSYITNPPQKRTEVARHENFSAINVIADVNRFRAKLAAERGMTLEQWLEAEKRVQHPREIVPVTPSLAVIAKRRMQAAGVPEKFIGDVVDKTVDCKPLRDVRAFLSGPDAFLFVSGGKGTRKTGSACWALGQLDRGLFVHARELTRTAISQPDRWEALNRAPLVVLDDLGAEQGDSKGAFSSALSEVIDRVYSHGRRLIVTCNLTPNTFRQTYGEREYDRIREVGKWATVAGDSVRSYRGNDD